MVISSVIKFYYNLYFVYINFNQIYVTYVYLGKGKGWWGRDREILGREHARTKRESRSGDLDLFLEEETVWSFPMPVIVLRIY